MIERAYGKISLICDKCEAEETPAQDSEDFDILIDDAKEAGWRIVKEGGIWMHICPSGCQ